MRFKRFLDEAVIKPDLSFIKELKSKILDLTKAKSKIWILDSLTKIFANWFISFKVTDKQSRNDILASAGIVSADIIPKEPFRITIYCNDMSVFDDREDVEDYWFPALYEILGHELIHRQQLIRSKIQRKVNFSSNGNFDFKKYYSDKQEIMAFAHETMIYMLSMGLGKEEMLKAISSGLSKIDFINLQEFLEYFSSNTPEYKLFNKYLYQYIQTLN